MSPRARGLLSGILFAVFVLGQMARTLLKLPDTIAWAIVAAFAVAGVALLVVVLLRRARVSSEVAKIQQAHPGCTAFPIVAGADLAIPATELGLVPPGRWLIALSTPTTVTLFRPGQHPTAWASFDRDQWRIEVDRIGWLTRDTPTGTITLPLRAKPTGISLRPTRTPQEHIHLLTPTPTT